MCNIKICWVAPLAFFLLQQSVSAQHIDEVRRDCSALSAISKINLMVSPFRVSASPVEIGMGSSIAHKIIEHLGSIVCFRVHGDPATLIPGGTQAYITGTLTDYYSSEKAMGKPRIQFDIEIRNAKTQQLIATKNIKVEGKLYLGVGTNKPLSTAWLEALNQSAIFIYNQMPVLALLQPAEETKVQFANTEVSVKERVRTKSIYEQMEDNAKDKMERDRKIDLMLSEYYNDSSAYNEFSKTPP